MRPSGVPAPGATDPTDEEAMAAVRAGDAGALGRLFDRHHLALFEFLCRTVGERAAAEDLVQEVFLRILKYRHTYRDGSSFVTWMFRIARNARADHFRRRQAGSEIEQLDVAEHEPPSTAPSATERLEWATQARHLRRALEQLPADKRELIVLARYRQLPYGQIADLFDADAGTIKVRVHRALKQLRALLEQATPRREPCDVKTPSSTSSRS